jgi:starch synthase (maltosyl-transferring)
VYPETVTLEVVERKLKGLTMERPNEGRARVAIENLEPELSCGRFSIKRIVGETVEVEADVFADGHDEVEARLLWRQDGDTEWRTSRMTFLGNDRWRGRFSVTHIGRYFYTVAGAIDRFGTWRHDLEKRIAAGQDLTIPMQTGAILLEQIASTIDGTDASKLQAWAQEFKAESSDASPAANVATLALSEEIAETVRRYPDRALETRYRRELGVIVDRKKAGFSAWYELFPRSWSRTPGKHGTFRDVAGRLEYVAEMGFDVLYLPPIHPIGRSFRKGRNNAIEAAPGDVGSPWAIGSSEGGHTAIHPALGTMEDFEYLLERAGKLGLQVALDIAFQCAPDHPWVTEHPEFFKKRPDGSIQYAENPPKKYQDIYPLDFESSNWKGLWNALKEVFQFWIDKGVRIFRVDNPHTKAFPFWEWVIDELKEESPDVLFLAEAFTRPRVMEQLAKLGFSQSYTYFAWRNTKEEIVEYMQQLTQTQMREYFRPNFWPNTPDILTESLQIGGPAAFKSRFVLAATLTANYGIYGPAFELGEHLPIRHGSEEYLNSEKYEIRTWDLDSPHSLKPLITRVNHARRDNPALQGNLSLHFHVTDNPLLLCYSKSVQNDLAHADNTILVVVNLDPFHQQSGWVALDLQVLGIDATEAFEVEDLLVDQRYLWRGSRNYVELRPQEIPAHLFRIRKHIRTEKDFDYYR